MVSDRKYEFAYIVMRRNIEDNSSIPCAVFHGKDMNDAMDTSEAYNQKFKDDGIEGFIFEVQVSALYD